jgi:hypothetical protein
MNPLGEVVSSTLWQYQSDERDWLFSQLQSRKGSQRLLQDGKSMSIILKYAIIIAQMRIE